MKLTKTMERQQQQ